MERHHGYWRDSKDTDIFLYAWLPDADTPCRGIVQIVHGMVETAARYERLALALASQGYAVYAHDQLGHGKTAGSPESAGIFEQNSFRSMARHVGELAAYVRKRHDAKLPLYMLGHSMGSFVVQMYMGTHMVEHPPSGGVQGIVLSGSNGKQGAALGAGLALAAAEARIRGEYRRSPLLHALTFGAYNKKIAKPRTPFDWLSRDSSEVAAYEADPYCGVVCNAGFYRDFFRGLKDIHKPSHLRNVPKDVPIYIFSGDQDPVGEYGRGVERLIAMYRGMGVQSVTGKLYPGGRHEMLNETNREEVVSDLLAWLERTAAAAESRE